ncbi:MAG: hypothetical protein ABL965_06705 [Nitrospira sp.]
MNSRTYEVEGNLWPLVAHWLGAGRLIGATSVTLIARRKDGVS